MTWKQRYESAHEKWFQQEYPESYKSGFYLTPKMPKVETANGLTTFCTKYCIWTDNHLERTNNMGVPVRKKIPKVNILSGKVENIDGGIEWRKGSGTKGSSDLKGHINNKNHKFPIPIYIEIKIKDKQSEEQKNYEKAINKSGAIYAIVHNPDEFFTFFDYVINLD